MTTVAIFIGRFQPVHNGHLFIMHEGLKRFDQLLVLVGSADRARSTVNPFTYDERIALIKSNLEALGDFSERVSFAPISDVFYDEEYWCQLVNEAVTAHIPDDAEITLIGHNKDDSTYYLEEFPDWSYLELPDFEGISATPLRLNYLLTGIVDEEVFPRRSQKFLVDFKTTETYAWLREEAQFIRRYRESWADSPFPPIFTTTDNVVLCQDHILLIRRAHSPGKDLLALPGGFVEEDEWIEMGLMRELFEETQIALEPVDLRAALRSIFLFDYPKRSQIGRVITHVGLFVLNSAELPAVAGNDDAGEAFWVPLDDFWQLSSQLHDDHYQIVQHLYRQGLFNDA